MLVKTKRKCDKPIGGKSVDFLKIPIKSLSHDYSGAARMHSSPLGEWGIQTDLARVFGLVALSS